MMTLEDVESHAQLREWFNFHFPVGSIYKWEATDREEFKYIAIVVSEGYIRYLYHHYHPEVIGEKQFLHTFNPRRGDETPLIADIKWAHELQRIC